MAGRVRTRRAAQRRGSCLTFRTQTIVRVKSVLFYFGVISAFGLLAFAFGYFDAELAEARRWLGFGMIVGGIAITLPAVLRLAEDWPRMKPRHNVDLAFGQIGLGVAVLSLACLMGGRAGAFFAPLVNPTPKLIAPVNQVPDANK